MYIKPPFFIVFFLVISVLTLSSCQSSTTDPNLSGNYIVILKKEIPLFESQQILTEVNTEEKIHEYTGIFNGFAAKINNESLVTLTSDDRIRYIIPDKPFRAFSQNIPAGLLRSRAGDVTHISFDGVQNENTDVDIAVIDSGVSRSDDLNLHVSEDFTGSQNAQDQNGHGTHVAGTIAAKDNQTGVVGFVPGARIWNLKVLDSQGSGTLSGILASLDYIFHHADEIEIVNMSLGGQGTNDGQCGLISQDPLHEGVCELTKKGVVFVVAAGNESQNTSRVIPAAYPEVITVGAYNDTDGKPGALGSQSSAGSDDSFANYSNYGSEVDVLAPGTDVISLGLFKDTSALSGTSMAAPHVSGALAQYFLTQPRLTTQNQVFSLIQKLQNHNSSASISGYPARSAPAVLDSTVLSGGAPITGSPPLTPGPVVIPTPNPSGAHYMRIEDYQYQVIGSSLYISFFVRNEKGQSVSQAEFSILVHKDGQYYGELKGSTGANGQSYFSAPYDMSQSCYQSHFISLRHSSLLWLPQYEVKDPGQCF